MKLKRFAAAALAFCLMLTLLPGGVSAEDVTSGNGWELAGGVLYVTSDVYSNSGANWASCAAAIKSVRIGKNVTQVSPKAFNECGALSVFTVEEGNTAFSAGDDGVLYTFNQDAIVCYPAARENTYLGNYDLGDNLYVVPKSVLKITRNAFDGLIQKNARLKIYAYGDTLTSVYSNYLTRSWDDFPATANIEKHEYVPVMGVRLDQAALSVEVGGTTYLKATVLPENATFPQVSWRREPEGFATVTGGATDENVTTGKVTGDSAGTAKIFVTTADKGYQASCTVTVVKKDVKELKLEPVQLKLGKDETRKLTATLTPANATDRTIFFRSTDPKVVALRESEDGEDDSGNSLSVTAAPADEDADAATATVYVHAVNPGTAYIEAVTQDKARLGICEVTVTTPKPFELPKTLELTLNVTGKR